MSEFDQIKPFHIFTTTKIHISTNTEQDYFKMLYYFKLYTSAHGKMHHALSRSIFGARASLKRLFYPFCCAECVTQTILYTSGDEEQKTTTQYLIRITVQIQVHAHNESQLPNILVSVTTLLQCFVVYMGNNFFFFPTHESQRI